MNVLAIGAHPDDIEYGCGGTLTLYAQKGHDVYIFVATDGSLGGDAAVRRREQEDSAVVMGVRKVYWGGYQDTEVPYNRELIVRVESVIRQARPAMIFVNYPDDTHQDHRNLAQAAVSATRYVPNFLFFEVPSTQNFTPNCYANIDKVLDRKLASLEAHRSQVTKTNIEDLTILELAVSCANFRGIQARVRYAEAFQSVRLLLDL
ncbi:MAG: PIG-L deacetylase family protein [Candidatus Rokuibacteriota bacterium]